MKELNRKSKDMITEKDAENEAKAIFIGSITKKMRRMGLLEKNAGPKSSCLLRNSEPALVLRETEHGMRAATQHSREERPSDVLQKHRMKDKLYVPELSVSVQWLIGAADGSCSWTGFKHN